LLEKEQSDVDEKVALITGASTVLYLASDQMRFVSGVHNLILLGF